MAQEPVEVENELALARRTQGARDLAAAFRVVFGDPVKLTVHQKLVLDHLNIWCGREEFAIMVDDGNATDLPRTFRALGRRDVIDHIHHLVSWKESQHGAVSGGTA